MPKRYITSALVNDPELKLCSPAAWKLWIHLVALSDDFGFVPAGLDKFARLASMTNSVNGISLKLHKELSEGFRELLGISRNLSEEGESVGWIVEYKDEFFWMFKPDKFDHIQAHLIQKRTRSKYLNVNKEDAETVRGFPRVSRIFLQSLGISRNLSESLGKSLNMTRARAQAQARNKDSTARKKSSYSSADEEGGVGETKPTANGKLPDPVSPRSMGGLRGVLPPDHESIPADLRMSAPRAPDRTEEVVRILKRIGYRTGIEKYQLVDQIGYASDIRRVANTTGFQCLVDQALRFEIWFCQQIETGQIKASAKHFPKSRFIATWCGRIDEKLFTTGDDEHWPRQTVDQYAHLGQS